MHILVDNTELNLLLTEKKEHIGKTITWDSVLSTVSFCFSVFLATYEKKLGIPGIIWKYICCGLGIAFAIKLLWDFYKCKKNLYTYEDLFDDINTLNEITSKHSIIVIKDTFNKFSNRYLVYDDYRWDCKFFPNYKNNENNENFIKSHLSSDLKIDVESICLEFVTQQIHKKYSNSNKVDKTYDHKFYLATIDKMPDYMKVDKFECDGKKYYWMTIPDLEKDKKVIEKNLDVLKIVKGYF